MNTQRDELDPEFSRPIHVQRAELWPEHELPLDGPEFPDQDPTHDTQVRDSFPRSPYDYPNSGRARLKGSRYSDPYEDEAVNDNIDSATRPITVAEQRMAGITNPVSPFGPAARIFGWILATVVGTFVVAMVGLLLLKTYFFFEGKLFP